MTGAIKELLIQKLILYKEKIIWKTKDYWLLKIYKDSNVFLDSYDNLPNNVRLSGYICTPRTIYLYDVYKATGLFDGLKYLYNKNKKKND